MHRSTTYSVSDISATITRSCRRKYATNPAFQRQASFGLRKPRPLADEHVQEVEKLTNTLIDLNAGEGSMRWKHTPSLRGEEHRIRQDLKAPRFMSEEQTKFAYSADPDELFTDASDELPAETFIPGTFVENRR